MMTIPRRRHPGHPRRALRWVFRTQWWRRLRAMYPRRFNHRLPRVRFSNKKADEVLQAIQFFKHMLWFMRKIPPLPMPALAAALA